MPNALYDKGREAFLKGQINWIADTIKVALVKTTVSTTPSTTEYKAVLSGDQSHQYLSSVPVDSIIATQTLIRDPLTATLNGVADGNDITFENIPAGVNVGAIIIYQQSSTFDRGSSRLIAYLDDMGGLPHSSGGNLKIQWDNGSNKIFKL